MLALDQGTTSSRALLFDQHAQTRSMAQEPTTQYFPKLGWVNQDASEIWLTTLSAAREALQRAHISGAQVAAIGIANQRETLVVWDSKSGRPVAPAIVWQSRQSQPQIAELLSRNVGPMYQRITGLVPDSYFTASKLAWLFDGQPELRRRAENGELLVGTVDSWLIWKLTEGRAHVTDATNASRTMLFDIRARDWSEDVLADLAIPRQVLPQVVASAGFVATVSAAHFGAEIPVTGIAGDQHAALFGQTCFSPGDTKNTFGTGSFLLMNTGDRPQRSTHQLLTTIAWQLGERTTYALEGSVFASGAAVAWLRDGIGIIKTSADVETLAASVPDSGGVSVVPALTGLGAPHWNASARGLIIGITRGTTAAHIARATLEAIAFQTRDVTDAMTRDAGSPLTILRVDGGAARNDLLMQIQADVLGVPVVRPKNIETTALGAAYLAGLGAGIWADQKELTSLSESERTFTPAGSSDWENRYATWRRATERAMDWVD
ncbi:MAG: glycerol kinase GlpK [Chloroflexota bacterium]|nr:glycerol kinase GlpK [Chloroflexota bacterium]